MTAVAAFDEILLHDPTSGSTGGSLLYLVAPPRTYSGTRVLSSGVEVEAAAKVPAVVVRGLGSSTYEETLEGALDAAQEALDVLSIGGHANLRLADPDSGHLAWWPQAGGTKALIWAGASVSMTGRATLTLVDSQGQEVPAPQPAEHWHESQRYFRHACTTDDVFDAFRNLYLALESILAAIAPQQMKPNGKPAEGEGEWLKRALGAADQILANGLGPFTRAGQVPDPLTEIYVDIYEGVRCRVFHAKQSRAAMLPYDRESRVEAHQALNRIARLYVGLVEAHLGTRFVGGGGLGREFAPVALSAAIDGMTFHLIRDGSPDAVEVQLGPAPDLEEDWLGVRRGGVSPVAITETIGRVTSLIGSADGVDEPAFSAPLGGSLSVAGFDSVDVVVALRSLDWTLLKTRYVS